MSASVYSKSSATRYSVNIFDENELVEGDMQLTVAQKLAMYRGFRNTAPKSQLWAGGVVPYKIRDPQHKLKCWDKLIRRSLRDLSEETGGCIKFRKAQSKDRDYINIVYGNRCSSWVGKKGGMQNLNLGEQCNSIRAIQHEFIHALGFSHEQSRADRDKHVKIRWENIDSAKCYNFGIRGKVPKGQEYDIDSIMHYRTKEFSCNGEPTITTLEGKEYVNCGMLSDTDVKKIKALYGCK